MKLPLLVSAFACLSAVTCSAATIVMTSPVRYRSETDSPYLDQLLAGTAALQNFEDLDDECCENLVLDRQGGELKETQLFGGGGRNTSVDGDDGLVDEVARTGCGWSSSGNVAFPFMEFEFVPLAGSGALPLWFGFAITNANPPDPVSTTTMQIIGANNVLLANLDLRPLEAYVRGIPLDDRFNPVGNDVFVSWQSSEPIMEVRINGRNALVLDHFQFGYTIPEPSCAALLAAVCGYALRRSRRAVQSCFRLHHCHAQTTTS